MENNFFKEGNVAWFDWKGFSLKKIFKEKLLFLN